MKILVTGGGSGGHITPALAVIYELKQLRPDAYVVYVAETGDRLGDVPAQDKNIDEIVSVRAGKFRRYHGAGWRQLLDVETLYKNLRDIIWILIGTWQSYRLLGKTKPDVIFTRGSFVSVPICWAAALRGIPYVTHDSDSLPGLANRLIAPWAKVHAVGLPKEVYTNYPPSKTITVGVPISSHLFYPLSAKESSEVREQLQLQDAGKVLFATGGGHGADRLNRALIVCAPELLERYPDLWIVHVAGRQLEADARKRYKQLVPKQDQHRVIVKGFITNLYQYSGLADVVLTRAGMTSLYEFAAQGKACVVVPNPELTGGHQTKNAKVLADHKAIRMVSEENLRQDPKALMPALTEILDDPARAEQMGARLAKLAQPNASHLLAVLVLEIAEGKAFTA